MLERRATWRVVIFIGQLTRLCTHVLREHLRLVERLAAAAAAADYRMGPPKKYLYLFSFC